MSRGGESAAAGTSRGGESAEETTNRGRERHLRPVQVEESTAASAKSTAGSDRAVPVKLPWRLGEGRLRSPELAGRWGRATSVSRAGATGNLWFSGEPEEVRPSKWKLARVGGAVEICVRKEKTHEERGRRRTGGAMWKHYLGGGHDTSYPRR
jgi:hypothetical protein